MATLRFLALYIFVFLLSMSTGTPILAVSEAVAPMTTPGCSSHCGDVEIPYPFGIEPGCYFDEWFQILCERSTGHPKPFLNCTHLEVWEISIVDATIRVTYPISYSMCSNNLMNTVQTFTLEGSSFLFSTKNRFTSICCGGIALLNIDGFPTGGCMSLCIVNPVSTEKEKIDANGCSGINCCQTTIPLYLNTLNSSFQKFENEELGSCCTDAFLVDQDWLMSNFIYASSTGQILDPVPVLLEWSLADYSPPATSEFFCENYALPARNFSRCFCSDGYHGNPYTFQGCQDVNECDEPSRCGYGTCTNYPGTFTCQMPYTVSQYHDEVLIACCILGIFLVIFMARWLKMVIKKREQNKRREKFFKQNGGLLLQQQLSTGKDHIEKIKLFTSKELHKATDEFNENRVLGHGSQGTVYKGMLEDGRIVAVKKSKIVDAAEVEQFINEIVILSQINHRNVVKLLGCCLETEVPLLVYEFILNGSLSQYIHHHNDFRLTWEMRLRISMQVAGALSYLHSSTCLPIYHRDIKSGNILLDDKFNAKVADFGTSRSITIDKTHLTTLVKGTFGYIDPGYFQSSQFTDKSDVYSFGVVLVELLTGRKPVFLTQPEERRSLATHFIESMEENSLFDIIDVRVMKDGWKEEIMAVADLAKRCLDLNGKKRPTMKEVALKLEEILLLVTS